MIETSAVDHHRNTAAPYESYVICTSPRSGSTLLCKLLGATGIAGNPGSHFHDPSVSEWLGYYDFASDIALPERDILAMIFRSAIAVGRHKSQVFGLRLQRHSFDFFVQKLAVLHDGFAGDRQRFEAAFGRTLFIHLTRGDKVEQAVSYTKAEQSGLWHMAPGGTELERLSPPRTPAYNFDEIRERFEEVRAYDRDWLSWFASEDIHPLRITYEALAADPIATLRQILTHLGLDGNAAKGVEPGVAKLADKTSHDWVARFRTEYDQL